MDWAQATSCQYCTVLLTTSIHDRNSVPSMTFEQPLNLAGYFTGPVVSEKRSKMNNKFTTIANKYIKIMDTIIHEFSERVTSIMWKLHDV